MLIFNILDLFHNFFTQIYKSFRRNEIGCLFILFRSPEMPSAYPKKPFVYTLPCAAGNRRITYRQIPYLGK